MARCSDAGKHAEWCERLERFSRSGFTVARFCGGERVSVASFYHWRKKLGQAAPRRRVPARPGIFRRVAVVAAPPAGVPAVPAVVPAPPAMVPAAPAVVAAPPAGVAAAPAGVPASPVVVPAASEMVPAALATAPATPAGVAAECRVSIQLPCGTRIEVDAEHLDAVRAVVGEVARAHRGLQTGIPSC